MQFDDASHTALQQTSIVQDFFIPDTRSSVIECESKQSHNVAQESFVQDVKKSDRRRRTQVDTPCKKHDKTTRKKEMAIPATIRKDRKSNSQRHKKREKCIPPSESSVSTKKRIDNLVEKILECSGIQEAAAIQIQRVVRGGIERMKHRIRILEEMLHGEQQKSDTDIWKIQQLFKYQKKPLSGNNFASKEEEIFNQSQKEIQALRRKNKELREKNDKMEKSICKLKMQTKELRYDKSRHLLCQCEQQVLDMEQLGDQLRDLLPEYEKAINEVQDALNEHQRFCIMEYKVKMSVLRNTRRMVSEIQQRCADDNLVKKVVSVLESQGEKKCKI